MAETWLVKGEFPGPEEVLFLPQAPLTARGLAREGLPPSCSEVVQLGTLCGHPYIA